MTAESALEAAAAARNQRNLDNMNFADFAILEKARQAFEDLKTTTVNYSEISIDSIIKTKIKEPLASIGKTLAALDPSGESTVKQIENDLQQAKIRIQIRSARKGFAEFETTNVNYSESSINFIPKEIKKLLADAGEELSVLDPSGASNNAQIEARFQQAAERIRIGNDPARQRNIGKARQAFATIETTTTGNDVEVHAKNVRHHLSAAGAPMAALDKTGLTSSLQMEMNLNELVRRGHLLQARKEFSAIETTTTGNDIEVRARNVRHHLSAAQASVSALDPTFTSTNQQMQERLDKAVARGHALKAIKDISEPNPGPYALTDAKKNLAKLVDYLDAQKPFNQAAKGQPSYAQALLDASTEQQTIKDYLFSKDPIYKKNNVIKYGNRPVRMI